MRGHMAEHWQIDLDYPVRPKARWGYGRPPLQPVADHLERGRARYAAVLERCLVHRDRFAAISADYVAEDEPYWQCGWLPPLDLVLLYTMVAEQRPARYVEVGSGCSTAFVRRAVDDLGLATRIISIDPQPRAEIDAVCDEVIRQPLEDIDLDRFDDLTEGDVVFVDGSHRCFSNSDATVAVLEVLPRLRHGVVIGFDDICLPHDYPPHWADRFYSEQFLLAAWLLGGGGGTEVIAPIDFVSHDEELKGIVAPLWDEAPLAGLITYGNSFWMHVSGATGTA
jgi:predicted O-methyltransferase YrrM